MTDAKLTPKKAPRAQAWRRTFLTVLRNTANVRAACEKAGITRARAYKAKDDDANFSAQWDEAVEDAVDILEGIAQQRARETSDVLLIFLLKAHRPAKYREVSRHEISGRNGEPIQIKAVDYRKAIAELAPTETGSVDDSDASSQD